MRKQKLMFRVRVGLKTWWFHVDGEGIVTMDAGGTKQRFLHDFNWSWDVTLERVQMSPINLKTMRVIEMVNKRATEAYLQWRTAKYIPKLT